MSIDSLSGFKFEFNPIDRYTKIDSESIKTEKVNEQNNEEQKKVVDTSIFNTLSGVGDSGASAVIAAGGAKAAGLNIVAWR